MNENGICPASDRPPNSIRPPCALIPEASKSIRPPIKAIVTLAGSFIKFTPFKEISPGLDEICNPEGILIIKGIFLSGSKVLNMKPSENITPIADDATNDPFKSRLEF